MFGGEVWVFNKRQDSETAIPITGSRSGTEAHGGRRRQALEEPIANMQRFSFLSINPAAEMHTPPQ